MERERKEGGSEGWREGGMDGGREGRERKREREKRANYINRVTHRCTPHIMHLYPGEGANYGWIKGKSVLTFVM